MSKLGFTHSKVKSNRTAISGSEASDWVDTIGHDYLFKFKEDLLDNPSVDNVIISLGGNDLLSDWNVNLTTQQEDSLLDIIIANFSTIINYVYDIRSDLNIFISCYDYMNFPVSMFLSNVYVGKWEDIGEPTVPQINEILIKLELRKEQLCEQFPKVHYMQTLGLMQYHYGYEADFGITTWTDIYQPHEVPFPFGDPNWPTPKKAMLLEGADAIHLDESAYEVYADFQYRNYMDYYLRNMPDETFNSIASQDGTIDEQGTIVDNEIQVGAESLTKCKGAKGIGKTNAL